MKKSSLFLLVLLTFTISSFANAQSIDLWPVDVCDKIFADSAPGTPGTIKASAAANEYESAQFGLRADRDVEGVALSTTPLVCEANGTTIDAENIRLRPIGMIPIARNTQLADEIITRKAPCDMPDVLYERDAIDLKKGESQGVWVTIRVPQGTAAGKYVGKILLKGSDFEMEEPLELEVFPFELPERPTLSATYWWFHRMISDYHHVDYMSEEHWKLIEAYVRDMGEHRLNVFKTQWLPSKDEFVKATIKKDGTWEFDFSQLERLLTIAEKYGAADRLEMTHIGRIDRERHTINFLNRVAFDEDDPPETLTFDEAKGEYVSVSFDQWFEPTFKAVCDYLRKTGRFEKALFHVVDEPYQPDVGPWRDAADLMRSIEPDVKLLDAIEAVNFSDKLNVWVPKLNHFAHWRDAFEARRDGNEFWFYICCFPYGKNFPNRFMDLPGARVRAIHWVNYAENLPGFLHLGYNYWFGDAFGAPTTVYAPGDGHVVYPGENGPLDSIRWELERESLEDYEYLKILERKIAEFKEQCPPERGWAFDPTSRSMELARRIVPDIAHTTLDASLIEKTRREIVDEIAAATDAPRLIVQTFPEDRAVVYPGPILGELHGATTPGATVTINGDEIKVDENGFFEFQIYMGDKGDTFLNIVATLNGRSVKTSRHFIVGK